MESYILESHGPGPNVRCTWICDHYVHQVTRERTRIGGLVYRAKYCADSAAMHQLQTAVRHVALQLRTFAKHSLAAVEVVTHVPSNPRKQPFNVPTGLAAAVAEGLGVIDISPQVTKTRMTPPAKTAPALDPDAYSTALDLTGRHVLIVDDVYRTGTTLESVATSLRKARAADVIGLCAAKAVHGLN